MQLLTQNVILYIVHFEFQKAIIFVVWNDMKIASPRPDDVIHW